MKKYLTVVAFCAFALLTFISCNTGKTIELYVSPEGNDNASGSLSEPLASIPKAVELVRELRKNGNSNPATIYLRDGRHQLNQTLVLGIKDGLPPMPESTPFEEYGAEPSTGPAHLTFAAYPGEHPVVSSGVLLTGWQKLESPPSDLPANAIGKVWVADMPEALEKFYTLYDEKGRLNRARGAGFAPAKPGDRRTLHFPEGSLRNWDNVTDVEIQIRPSRAWVVNMLPLESVDETKGIALTSVSATYEMSKLPPYLLQIMGDSVASAWVENVLEELDEPGEWVVNSHTRKIYLWPSDPAPDGSPHGILAPTSTELIRVEGVIDYDGPTDTPVRGITFSGLTFSHADRWAWIDDKDRVGWGMQHDWDMFNRPTAMLRFRGAEECLVTDCRFVASGGSGVRMDLHAQRNRVINSEFTHLGEAGILLSGYGPGTKDVNHHNDIINNHIHHFSEITWHSPGVWAWQSGHNHIANNFIHHAGYSGILATCRVRPDSRPNSEGGRTVRHAEIAQSAKENTNYRYEGWKRRAPYLHARHNVVEYNEITHLVQKLADGNGIYVSGTGGGNIIRYNYLHDNSEAHLPAPIRCDGDQHETLIQGNVLYHNSAFASGIASHGINDIINNFIVAPLAVPRKGYLSFIQYPVTGAKVTHNIIISHPDGGMAHGEIAKNQPGAYRPNIEETEMDSNLYYHPRDPAWMDEHLQRMQAVGKEMASLFADPMFIDPAGDNFGFREGSPALKLGIESLDVSKMGLLNKSENPELPVSSGLVLDLNADRGLTIEDDSMVTTWTNQAPKPLAVDFLTTEEGRTKTIITQDEPGTGRPTLVENSHEINGHNSLVFREDELINDNDEAFHGMMTGGGYTWFAVLKPYKQGGPGKINSRYPNAFFGCLRNSGPPQKETGQYAGFWGSFYPDGRVYMGSRNGLNEKVRDGVNTPEVESPPPSINEWHIIMGRQGSGQGTVLLELFVDDPSEAVNSSDFPVGDVEPSRMAIGTERNAINHQGKESFDGELARLLMYETALDQQEMKDVYDYLRTVYF